MDDKKWVIPIVFLVSLLVIGFTHIPSAAPWYQQIEDHQVKEVTVTEMANWIVQGRNDFLPVQILTDGEEPIANIDGLLSATNQEELDALIAKQPTYKTWVLITENGDLSSEAASKLTGNWERKVTLLTGGSIAWADLITADQAITGDMNQFEVEKLGHVRPYFHQDTDEDKGDTQFFSPGVAKPPMLKEIEEEELEEGC